MRASPYEGVSLRAPCEVFRHFLFFDKYYENWQIRKMPSTHVVVANPCRRYKPSDCLWLQHLLFFFHISCLLLHNLIDFKLTGLWSLVKLLFWAQRSRKIIWLIPRSEMHLMPKTRVHLPLAPFLTKGVVSSSARFSFPYISRSFLIFLHFILADLWERDREKPSLLTLSILSSLYLPSVFKLFFRESL